jgi:hypothetical protein
MRNVVTLVASSNPKAPRACAGKSVFSKIAASLRHCPIVVLSISPVVLVGGCGVLGNGLGADVSAGLVTVGHG